MDLNKTLAALSVGLPEDIQQLKMAGFYEEAVRLIDRRLAENWYTTGNRPYSYGMPEAGLEIGMNPMTEAPSAQLKALIAEREILCRTAEEFPYTAEQALAMIRERIPDFTEEEFRALDDENRMAWRYVNGVKHYDDRFLATMLGTDAGFAARAGEPHTSQNADRIHHAMDVMQKKGQMGAKIHLRASVRAGDAAFHAAKQQALASGKNTVTVKVWLPLPIVCPSQAEIELNAFSEEPTFIAPENAAQRTVFWQAELEENREFSVEYTYVQHARYVNPWSRPADRHQPQQYLGEQMPHIRFTPFLKALVKQLTEDIADPVEKAKRIYDYLTLNVRYLYMPSYFIMEDIADNCARTRRGDCGVMALAFITMCRIAGIPARWESGLSVTPTDVGCHDWARFYIAPLGWMYADCSFGASAARDGDEQRRNHYFGNLDPYRMVANSAFQKPFVPPMESWRSDPYDNQSGELELEGVGLYGEDLLTEKELVEFTEL